MAARACPAHVECTFFALLMSVYNAGLQGSQWTGGHLYDSVGFENLVLISTAPSVEYQVHTTAGETLSVHSPAEMPPAQEIVNCVIWLS